MRFLKYQLTPDPVRPFADGLRRTLAKAREQKILPFTQMSEAASRPPVPSPQGSEAAALGMAAAEAVAQFPGFNPFPWQDPVQTTSAEASSHPIVALPNSHSVQSTPWPHAPDNFDLAAWFPPPGWSCLILANTRPHARSGYDTRYGYDELVPRRTASVDGSVGWMDHMWCLLSDYRHLPVQTRLHQTEYQVRQAQIHSA